MTSNHRHFFRTVVSVTLVVQAMLLAPLWAAQERAVISSSPTPVGSGARAAGMANAFIAIADDATAASWNPAGLVQLERPEVSAVGSFRFRADDFAPTSGPNIYKPEAWTEINIGEDTTSSLDLNYFSIACPFELLNRNITVSINYQHKYNFDRNYDGSKKETVPADPPWVDETDELFWQEQRGGLAAVSPALAMELIPDISVGIAFNIWVPEFFKNTVWEAERGWHRNFISSRLNEFSYERDTFDNFFGWNTTIGLLARMGKHFSLGCVFHLPFSADVNFHRTRLTIWDTPGSYPLVESNEKGTIDFPLSYGIGIAYRANDALSFSMDFMRVEWADFLIKFTDGNTYSAVTGKSLTDSDFVEPKPSDTIRFGGEYLIVAHSWVVPLRAGLFFDPQPREGEPDDFFGICFGSGLALKDLAMDLAYQYRFGNRAAPTVSWNISSIADASTDVQEHIFLFSSIYYF